MKTLFLFLAIIFTATYYITQASAGTTVILESADVFGFFLPPGPGEKIGDHESDGIAFMTASDPATSDATIFPDGFITTRYYVQNDDDQYVQVTGQLDNSFYVDPNDDGGQYDYKKSPVNGACSGYPYFVNLIEPNDGIYCIRCCKNKVNCPTGKSTHGCKAVIGGRY